MLHILPEKAQKLACFVLYLKISIFFWKILYASYRKLFKEVKNNNKIKVGQAVLELSCYWSKHIILTVLICNLKPLGLLKFQCHFWVFEQSFARCAIFVRSDTLSDLLIFFLTFVTTGFNRSTLQLFLLQCGSHHAHHLLTLALYLSKILKDDDFSSVLIRCLTIQVTRNF